MVTHAQPAQERPSLASSHRGSKESAGRRNHLDPTSRKLSSGSNHFGVSAVADGHYAFPPLTDLEIEEETEEDLAEVGHWSYLTVVLSTCLAVLLF
jgi:hypothetical protein